MLWWCNWCSRSLWLNFDFIVKHSKYDSFTNCPTIKKWKRSKLKNSSTLGVCFQVHLISLLATKKFNCLFNFFGRMSEHCLRQWWIKNHYRFERLTKLLNIWIEFDLIRVCLTLIHFLFPKHLSSIWVVREKEV